MPRPVELLVETNWGLGRGHHLVQGKDALWSISYTRYNSVTRRGGICQPALEFPSLNALFVKIHLFDKDPKFELCPAGQTIFTEGETGQTMFAVIEGSVDVIIRGHIVETVEAGGVFGEMALVDDRPRTATAVTRMASKLVSIDRQRFTFVVQNHPFFALQLMSVMAERLRKVNSRL